MEDLDTTTTEFVVMEFGAAKAMGYDVVADYGVFTNIVSDADKLVYTFCGVKNGDGLWIDNQYTSEKYKKYSAMVSQMMANACEGKMTYGLLFLSEHHILLSEIYTSEQIKQLISPEDFKKLNGYFYDTLKENIAKQKEYDILNHELEELSRNRILEGTLTLGSFQFKHIISDREYYLKKCRAEVDKFKVYFPVIGYMDLSKVD